MKSPILFLVFNRVDETIQSFETIRKAKPSRLYIAADGARSSVPGEVEVCNSVRDIVTNVDWDCEVITLFREHNLGCKMAIVGAINWFFDNEEQGIIIEDDIIPKSEFFQFCDIMLDKYKEFSDIKVVSGFNQFGQDVESNSYYFSRGFYAWGWATWRSRWVNYKVSDIDVSLLEGSEIKEIYDRSAIDGVKFNLRLINKGFLDTWDYQMLYMIMVEKGFVVAPYANLTTNIGANGAHSVNNKNIFFKYGSISISNLLHPDKIEDNHLLNQKLWNEYKEAYFLVKVKRVLLNINMYKSLRDFYKRVRKIAG